MEAILNALFWNMQFAVTIHGVVGVFEQVFPVKYGSDSKDLTDALFIHIRETS